MILEEFDGERDAVINPSSTTTRVERMPEIAVTCFSRVTFSRLLEGFGGDAEVVAESSLANMAFPIYRVMYRGRPYALFLSDVGAPACVGLYEEVYEMGVGTVVVFGTCGVLDSSIEDCSIIVPTCAIRDEGTSFHYQPASDEIEVNPLYREEFFELLDSCGCTYVQGKVWTTDAIYRETREKVARRRAQGCICVDMECSALAALARFRGKELFQFFYAADNLDAEEWDARSLANNANLAEKDRVAMLAIRLAERIAEGREEHWSETGGHE